MLLQRYLRSSKSYNRIITGREVQTTSCPVLIAAMQISHKIFRQLDFFYLNAFSATYEREF